MSRRFFGALAEAVHVRLPCQNPDVSHGLAENTYVVRGSYQKWMVVALVVVAAAVSITVLYFARRARDEPALREAKRACLKLEEFQRGVNENDSAERVLADLTEAEKSAKRAADQDQLWIPLLGGVQSIRIALDEDDPAAARVGIVVSRTECAKIKSSS